MYSESHIAIFVSKNRFLVDLSNCKYSLGCGSIPVSSFPCYAVVMPFLHFSYSPSLCLHCVSWLVTVSVLPLQDWFVVNPTTTKSFEKLMKIKQRQQEEEKRRQQHRSRRSLRRRQQPGTELPETQPSPRVGKDQRRNGEELVVSTSCKESEQEPVPTQPQKVKPPKTTHKRGRK
jgi:hypothetical protein